MHPSASGRLVPGPLSGPTSHLRRSLDACPPCSMAMDASRYNARSSPLGSAEDAPCSICRGSSNTSFATWRRKLPRALSSVGPLPPRVPALPGRRSASPHPEFRARRTGATRPPPARRPSCPANVPPHFPASPVTRADCSSTITRRRDDEPGRARKPGEVALNEDETWRSTQHGATRTSALQ